eukprot:6206619-Pleurochrysis_carterae.AAC.4
MLWHPERVRFVCTRSASNVGQHKRCTRAANVQRPSPDGAAMRASVRAPARRFARLEVDGGQHPFAVARYEHARRARLCNQRTRLTKPLSVHACFRVRPRLLRLLRVRRDGLPAPHRHRELTHAEVGTCTAQQVALLLRAQADGAPLTQRAALLQPSETRGREPLLPLVRARMNG